MVGAAVSLELLGEDGGVERGDGRAGGEEHEQMQPRVFWNQSGARVCRVVRRDGREGKFREGSGELVSWMGCQVLYGRTGTWYIPEADTTEDSGCTCTGVDYCRYVVCYRRYRRAEYGTGDLGHVPST